MSNKVYDILKWTAQIVIPAIGTLYFAIASIWGLPYGEEIVGTLTAIDVFLGALLGVSTSSYEKGIEEGEEEATCEKQEDATEEKTEEATDENTEE